MKLRPFSLCLLAMTSQLAAHGVDHCETFLNVHENRFYAKVDYLAWFANQEGLSFATKAQIANSESGLIGSPRIGITKEEDRFFENKWDYGIRGAFGFKPHCWSWETRVVYTYFSTKVHPKPLSSILVNTNGLAIIPEYVGVILPSAEAVIEGESETADYSLDPLWKLYFNALDLELVRKFNVSYDMTLTPSIGLRGLFMHQTFEESIQVIDTVTSLFLPTNISEYLTSFTERNRFTGVGARAGFDIKYSLWKGLGLYGNFNAGLIWGYFNVQQKLDETMILNSTLVGADYEPFKHSHQSSIFNLDLALGFCWNISYNCDLNELYLRFGWEQHLFTNINQFQNFLTASTEVNSSEISYIADRNVVRGNLTLSGFVAGLGLNF